MTDPFIEQQLKKFDEKFGLVEDTLSTQQEISPLKSFLKSSLEEYKQEIIEDLEIEHQKELIKIRLETIRECKKAIEQI